MGAPLIMYAVLPVDGKATVCRELRKLVDIGINLIVAGLFCDHAAGDRTGRDEQDDWGRKKLAVAKHWLAWKMPECHMLKEQIFSGNAEIINDFETLAGPVPVAE